ncbi:MAG: trypsin-like serine protease [Spirulina sp. SIO3F2]|nr:trypsin-like serine protease [Spirulina sp. SIO3F2]
MTHDTASNSPRRPWLHRLTLVVLGAGLALGGNHVYNSTADRADTLTRETAQAAPSPAALVPTNFVAEVVQQSGDAVVRIDAQRTVQQQLPPALQDPFFRRFFEIPDTPQERVQQGSGSGFIISQTGHILTNAHVIEGADTVTVTLKDGRSLKGKVLGTDPVTDVAVVQVEADDLPVIALGDSERLQPGEWAIAIGNPLGLDNTVTTGIISGTGRSSSQIGVPDKRVNFIQTDAAINPGNSGGPLLNQNGEVIGINTAIIRNAQGLGFAIPINQAQEIADQLIATGKVDHPFLGIQMTALNPAIASQFEQQTGQALTTEAGVIVMEVLKDSPAARGGLKAGDVIEMIQDKPITTAAQVQQHVAQTQTGDRLDVQVNRQGETVDLDITVGVLNR